MKYIFALLLLAGIPLKVWCQTDSHDHDHDHGTHNHAHHKNEIGLANMVVYNLQEEDFSYGLHIHYLRSIAESPFSLGLGYEIILDEHRHNTIGLVGSYRPIDELSFSVSPGFTFEGAEAGIKFALHLETAYEFAIKNFHLGPIFEFGYDPEDIHLSLGLHIGIGF